MFALGFHSLFSELGADQFEILCSCCLHWFSPRGIHVHLIERGLRDDLLT